MKTVDMETTLENLEEQALALPVMDRLQLAKKLLHCSTPLGPEMTKEEWEAELKRRVDSVKSGDDSGVSWEEIQDEFERRYRN